MTTASRPLATALWRARFAGAGLPSCYTTWGDTTIYFAKNLLNLTIQLLRLTRLSVVLWGPYSPGAALAKLEIL